MPDRRGPIRIVIADDHPIFRDGLRRLLAVEPDFVVVGEGADGHEAVERVRALRPDVLLLDLAMPGGGGLDTLRELAEGASDVRTVLLTASIDREDALEAVRLGARGVVLKTAATPLLYKCIRAVVAGEYWIGHERVHDLVASLREFTASRSGGRPPASTLTRRETQVALAVLDGASNKEIAEKLGLGEQTVKNHLSSIFDKLGVSSRLELALYAVHHRLAGDKDQSA
jgi:two-component system, NarL family, nitrate/nitrite response regulator NarL